MADFLIISQPTAVWEANNPTLQANELGVCSDLRDGVETDSLLSKLGNGVDNWDTLPAYNPGGYKVYRALLTQTGTDAPVATVLENSLGGTVVWTYTDVGIYRGTLTGAFPNSKTHIVINSSQTTDGLGASIAATAARVSENIVEIKTVVVGGAAFNEQLLETSIQILVYP